MSFDSNRDFLINTSGQPVATGQFGTAAIFNALMQDLAAGLSHAYKRGNVFDVSRPPYNAVANWNGTTGTDDHDRVAAAISDCNSAGGGTVILPVTAAQGEYLLDGGLALNTLNGVTLEGVFRTFDNSPTTIQPGAIAFRNASDKISISACSGLNFRNISVDGNNVATDGIHADQLLQSFWQTVSVVRLAGTTGKAFKFFDSSGTHVNSYNFLVNLYTAIVGIACEFSGTATSGAYHNTLMNPRFGFKGLKGLDFRESDNIRVFGLYMSRESGSGNGVYFSDPGNGNLPNSHSLYAPETSVGGVGWDPAITYAGLLEDFRTDNGQPWPYGFPGTVTGNTIGNKGWSIPLLFPGTEVSGTQFDVPVSAGLSAPADVDGLDKTFRFVGNPAFPSAGLVKKRNGVYVPAWGVVAVVTLSAQHADITATNFANSLEPGDYRIHYYIECTATDAGAGNLGIQFAWTDNVGLFTVNGNVTTLNTTTRTSGTIPAHVAVASPQTGVSWRTTIASGSYGTSRHNLHLTLEKLSYGA